MMNLVELVTDDMQEPAPCRYGNIVVGHACYCHNSDENAPRKCPIWRNGGRWSKDNCDFFEPAKVVAGDTAPDGHNVNVTGATQLHRGASVLTAGLGVAVPPSPTFGGKQK